MKKTLFFLSLSIFLIANEGEKLYTKYGCYGCHGIDAKGGNGFPNLKGKSKEYLIKRLLGYKNGSINSNRADMMKPYAKNLTEKEIEMLAIFLSTKEETQNRYYEEYDLSDAM